MATAEALLTAPYDTFATATSGAGAAQNIDIAAPADGNVQHIVQYVNFSFNAAPAAVGEVQIIQDPAGTPVVLARYQVPAALVPPAEFFLKGIVVAKGKAVRLAIPAGGGATLSSGQLGVITRPAP